MYVLQPTRPWELKKYRPMPLGKTNLDGVLHTCFTGASALYITPTIGGLRLRPARIMSLSQAEWVPGLCRTPPATIGGTGCWPMERSAPSFWPRDQICCATAMRCYFQRDRPGLCTLPVRNFPVLRHHGKEPLPATGS